MDNDDDEVEVEEALTGELDTQAARKLQMAQVLPLHNATGEFAKATGGRTRAVKRAGKTVSLPTKDDLEYLAKVQEAEIRYVEDDELVKAAKDKASAADVIRLALVRTAQNAASLEFQRIELQKRGEDTSQHISRHTKTLKEIAVLQKELRDLGTQTLDPHSEDFQKVFRLWAAKIQEVVKEVLSPELADLFYTKFMTVMEDWEDLAENALR